MCQLHIYSERGRVHKSHLQTPLIPHSPRAFLVLEQALPHSAALFINPISLLQYQTNHNHIPKASSVLLHYFISFSLLRLSSTMESFCGVIDAPWCWKKHADHHNDEVHEPYSSFGACDIIEGDGDDDDDDGDYDYAPAA